MSKSPPCFVANIDLTLTDKLRSDLLEQGFTLTTPPYTVFSAQKKGISCTLYTSGKLTVQGKDKDEFISFYLEPQILHTFTYAYQDINLDLTPRIGIDEAGKGDFFGPLCIGGVQADADAIKALQAMGVRDSKKMSDKTVLALSKKICQTCPHSIVRISPEKYNALYAQFNNLNNLLAWGHATAIGELFQKTGCRTVKIDQFGAKHLVTNALKRKKIDVDLTQNHRGEEDLIVAAASILARAAFLNGLEDLSRIYHIPLPKGASSLVIEAGKRFVAKQGKEALPHVAKMHFKSSASVLN